MTHMLWIITFSILNTDSRFSSSFAELCHLAMKYDFGGKGINNL